MSSFEKKEKISAHIPLELISYILARLPIADLLRVRHVCKSWNRLITSYSFISEHLNSSISNTESRVIVIFATENGKNEYYYLHRDNQAFDEIKELEPPRKSNENILIYGSSNGVFCCSYGDRDDETIYEESLFLWNPSLRLSMILPKSRKGIIIKHLQQRSVGFGFLPLTDNFKIVRVIHTQTSDRKYIVPPEVEIYEFFIGSWREVDATNFSYVLEHNCDQALVNGIVHWPAHDPLIFHTTSAYGGLIVSFDLTSEKFGTLMLPNSVQNDEDLYFFCVYTWKESLCLLHAREQYDVFIMKEYGKTDSWENLLSFERGDFMPYYLRENGEFLVAEELTNGEEEETWKLLSRDPKTNHNMDLGVHEDAQYFCKVYAYVDSLFLL